MKLNKKVLAILSIGHLVTDINQGALPALLPFFKEAFNLSYTITGIIPFACNLASSVIQPAFGYLSDRRPMVWLIPLAPFVACLGLSVSGLFSNYTFLILSVMVTGVGIASFHPEGFKTAYFFTGEKRATGMSIFAIGGSLGISLGPMTAVTLISFFGLKGTLGLVLPGIVIGIVLLLNRNIFSVSVESAHREAKKTIKHPLTKDQKISFSLLVIMGTIRAWAQLGLLVYIPFYYINFLKGNPLYVGKLVTTYLLSGVLGTLIGSPLADRWGHKKFLMITLLLSIPLFILFYNSSGLMVFHHVGIGRNGLILHICVIHGNGSGSPPSKFRNGLWNDGRVYHERRGSGINRSGSHCGPLGSTGSHEIDLCTASYCIWFRLIVKIPFAQ